jgi:hypothetical protein
VCLCAILGAQNKLINIYRTTMENNMFFKSNKPIDKSAYFAELDPTIFDFQKHRVSLKVVVFYSLLGVICLIWKYTFGLGIVIFLIDIIYILSGFKILFAKKLEENRITRKKELRLFDNPLVYGYNDFGPFIESENINIAATWSYINHYEKNIFWLRITVYGMPDFHYNIKELKEQNVYDELIDKLNSVTEEIRTRKPKN